MLVAYYCTAQGADCRYAEVRGMNELDVIFWGWGLGLFVHLIWRQIFSLPSTYHPLLLKS